MTGQRQGPANPSGDARFVAASPPVTDPHGVDPRVSAGEVTIVLHGALDEPDREITVRFTNGMQTSHLTPTRKVIHLHGVQSVTEK